MTLLAQFLDDAPPGTDAALAALACAESLTDNVALAIYEKVPVPGLNAEDFVSAFKYSGLTEPRNSEWNLTASLRKELVVSEALSQDAKHAVHRFLLSLGQNEANRSKAGSEVPSYLFTDAGLAYHFAGAGDVGSALEHYSAASNKRFNGAQWLGAKLAEEQEHTGVIPEGQVETTFLRAWVMLREGRKREAMPLFRKVAATDQEKREVAISLHLVGNENNWGQRKEAEQELRRSIEIDGKLGNEFGVALTLHSLGNLLSKKNGRHKEAEDAYTESIEILRELEYQFGVAQVLHSLGNLLSTEQSRHTEAEDAYTESAEIGRKIGNEFHVAQVLHSLGNLLSKENSRHRDAEKAYTESIEILRELEYQFGVGQVLHSLGNLLSKENGRHKEAEDAYTKSIEIRKKVGDEFGLAQTLHSFANLLRVQDGRLGEAEEFYRNAIAVLERLNNDNGVAQTLRSYALAIERRSPDEAIALLERSLDINRRRGNRQFVRLVERTIRDVRERSGR